MYSMKEAGNMVGMRYETLKFYCKEGLVPNVNRDCNNHRIFDDKNIAWLKGLQCLRKCGMSIKDMKCYLQYCLQGIDSIPQRKEMLDKTASDLLKKMQEIEVSLAFINDKQNLYDAILSGEVEYTSNVIITDENSPSS